MVLGVASADAGVLGLGDDAVYVARGAPDDALCGVDQCGLCLFVTRDFAIKVDFDMNRGTDQGGKVEVGSGCASCLDTGQADVVVKDALTVFVLGGEAYGVFEQLVELFCAV